MPTYMFPLTAKLRELLAKPFLLVKDDGIYLFPIGKQGVEHAIYSKNGPKTHQGGDDWSENFEAITDIPADAESFMIKLTAKTIQTGFELKAGAGTPAGISGPKKLDFNLEPHAWLETAIAMNSTGRVAKQLLARMVTDLKNDKLDKDMLMLLKDVVHKAQAFPESWGFTTRTDLPRQVHFKMTQLTQPNRDKLRRLGYEPARSQKGVWFKEVSW